MQAAIRERHREAQQKRLGQLLVEGGWITGEQLLRAIQSQRVVGGRIGTCLLEMEVLTEDHLLEALSRQLGVPAVKVEDLRHIQEQVLELVPAKVALRCQAIPFRATDNEVEVATLNVNNLGYLDELAFSSARRVRPHIANEARIFEALERYYGLECPRRYGHLLDRLNRSRFLWDEGARRMIDGAEGEISWAAPEEVLHDGLISSPAARSSVTARPLRSAPAGRERDRNGDEAGPQPAAKSGNGLLTLKQVDRLLAEQSEAQGLGEVLLRFLAQSFSRSALLKVRGRQLTGWLAAGDGIDRERFGSLEIGLAQPSVFQSLAGGTELYRGPLTPLPAHRQLAACWGGQLGADCVMMPIRVRDRLVSVLYGDRGSKGLQGLKVEQLQRLVQKASMAFELCILRKKIQQP